MNDEVLAVINSTNTAVLATLSQDGAPYATPITYTFENGRITWQSSPEAVHSRNIVRDGRASLSIIEKVEGKARAVYINGTAYPTSEEHFEEKWQQNLAQYTIELGRFDENHSTPGRFYFQESK